MSDAAPKPWHGVPWTPESNDSGYERISGSAFGYPVELEAGPDGRWVASLLNQRMTGNAGSQHAARAAAMEAAAFWLLAQALRLGTVT